MIVTGEMVKIGCGDAKKTISQFQDRRGANRDWLVLGG